MVNHWQVMRSEWVNGNPSDCIDKLKTMNRDRLIELVYQAIIDYRDANHESGDLQDLYEIITRYLRRKAYGTL